MIGPWDIGLATPADAAAIALLSRDEIERGLRWAWTPERVRRCLRDASTNVVVARAGEAVIGFALLEYHDADAHLLLLAVAPAWRRRGVGTALMLWLEATLRIAGIGRVQVEARAGNAEALAFYRALGFVETARLPRYYQQREDALQLVRTLSGAP